MLPELFGLNNHEKLHDALGDARSISQALRYLQMGWMQSTTKIVGTKTLYLSLDDNSYFGIGF